MDNHVVRERKLGLVILGLTVAVILIMMALTSCTVQHCPTYSGVNKHKYAKFKPYSLSKPLIMRKKHL